MRWNFAICVLLSSTIIASPVSNGQKQKRSLSFLKTLLLSDLGAGRTQERCTKTSPRKTLKENQISTPRRQKEDIAVPEKNRDGRKRKQMRAKPKNVRNNENTSLTNFANDYQIIPKTTTARTTTTEKSTEQKTKLQNFSGNKLIDEQIVMTLGDLNIDPTLYVTPPTFTMNELQYINPMIGMPVNPMTGMPVNPMIGMPGNPMIGIHGNPMIGIQEYPMIGMPRKYSYKKRKDDTVQTYSLDNKFDVIVSETNNHMPRPAYVGDTNKDLIFSTSPYVHEISPSIANQQYGDTIEHIISNVAHHTNQFHPAMANQQYQEAVIYPNMVFDQQHGNFGLKTLPNMYTGQPIIVIESEITKTGTAFQENEINKTTEQNVKEEPRGDIPE